MRSLELVVALRPAGRTPRSLMAGWGRRPHVGRPLPSPGAVDGPASPSPVRHAPPGSSPVDLLLVHLAHVSARRTDEFEKRHPGHGARIGSYVLTHDVLRQERPEGIGVELRNIEVDDLALYEAIHCDPLMMAELGGPLPREGLAEKLRREAASTEAGEIWVLKIIQGEEAGTPAGTVAIWEHEWRGERIN